MRLQIVDKAMAIKGLIARNELMILHEFAEKMDSIVEIGSLFGRSTYVLCSACKGPVYAVDHFMGGPGDTYPEFMENMKEFKNLTVIRMTSEEAAASNLIPPLVDMVWIDADHTKEAVKTDLLCWNHRARKLVCGHDFGYGHPGVEQALLEFYGLGGVVAPQSIWWANR